MLPRNVIKNVFLALFFLSGIAGLIYQIVWTRMLVLVFGNTLLANSTVLSAFMAGLAAGSFVLGEYIDGRPRKLLRLYAHLEVGIGLFGLAFPILVAAATPFYSSLYQAFDENLLLLNLFRFTFCFLLIVLPTFFMGGTLPVLVKYFVGSLDRIGHQVGFLYGLNTAGAVAGCIAAGYWLLGGLGMRQTTWVAVAINLGVALVAWAFSRNETERGELAGPADLEPHGSPSGTERHSKPVVVAVLVGIGISGFCALAYEVLWARMLNLFLNNNIYSVTATVATFLAGIALGSLVYSRFLSRIKSQLTLFAGIEIAIGLLAYATPFLFNLLQGALFSRQSEGFTMMKTAVVMIAPTFLMGIAVPLAVQICQWGTGREGRSVGAVYASNTVGSILGAFIAGFFLLPGLGLHRALIAITVLNIGAGFLVLAARRHRPLVLAGGYAAVVAILFAAAPSSLFRDLYRTANPGSEILHYKEGKVVNVVVYDFYKAGYKDLHLNGIEEASSRLWHVQLFKLLGTLPVVTHEDPDDALMIAFGAGMSAGACAQLVSSLNCVDLNPDIFGPAEIFRHENLNVIDNPRLNVLVNDGRNELMLSERKYSVIISDATNPKMYDSWTLYTREFYELAKSRLRSGGVFAQWLVVPLPGDSVKVILNTFRSVFPHSSLWCIYGSSQCLMLGTPEPLDLDFEDFSRRLAPVLEASEFPDYGVSNPAKYLSFMLLGERELTTLLADFEKISTDDLPHPQFELSSDLDGIKTMLEILNHQSAEEDYLRDGEPHREDVRRQLQVLRDVERRLYLGFLLNSRSEYLESAEVVRLAGLHRDENVASSLRHDKKRRQYFERRIAEHPEEAGAYNNLGYILWMDGEYTESIAAFERALELKPRFANARSNLAQVFIDAGMLDEAERQLLTLREENPTATVSSLVRYRLELVRTLRKIQYQPDSADLYMSLSAFHTSNGELVKAVRAAESAAKRRPDDTDTHLRLAALYEDLELVPQALESYRAAATREPQNALVQQRTAILHELMENPVALQRALRVEPSIVDQLAENITHPDVCLRAEQEWNTYDSEGTISSDQLRDAARLYEKSTRIDPDHVHAYLAAATIYEALGDRGKASTILYRASEVEPDNVGLKRELRRLELLRSLQDETLSSEVLADVWLELGRLYRDKGEGELAVDSLRRAIEGGHHETEIWLALAQAYLDIGKLETARDTLVQAIAETSSDTERRSLELRLMELERMLS